MEVANAIPQESLEPHEGHATEPRERFDKEIEVTIKVRVRGFYDEDGPKVQRAWIGSEEMPNMLVLYVNDECLDQMERQL